MILKFFFFSQFVSICNYYYQNNCFYSLFHSFYPFFVCGDYFVHASSKYASRDVLALLKGIIYKENYGRVQELRKVLNHNIQQIFFANDCRAIPPKIYKKHRNVIWGVNWCKLAPPLAQSVLLYC